MKEELNESKEELKAFCEELKEVNDEESAQLNGGIGIDPSLFKDTPCATVVPPEGGC